MNLALLFLLLQSVVTHKVTLTFDLYLPQPFCYGQCQIIGTTPTNPGWFNIYRSPQNTDGACGTFTCAIGSRSAALGLALVGGFQALRPASATSWASSDGSMPRKWGQTGPVQ